MLVITQQRPRSLCCLLLPCITPLLLLLLAYLHPLLLHWRPHCIQ